MSAEQGEWRCSQCGISNRRNRFACRNNGCGAPRIVSASSSASTGSVSSQKRPTQQLSSYSIPTTPTQAEEPNRKFIDAVFKNGQASPAVALKSDRDAIRFVTGLSQIASEADLLARFADAGNRKLLMHALSCADSAEFYNAAFVPLLERLARDEMALEPWYKGPMSREDAEQHMSLHNLPIVLRDSSVPGVLYLSMRRASGAVVHSRITRTVAGWTTIGKNNAVAVAPTVRALLEQIGCVPPPPAAAASTLFADAESRQSVSLKLAIAWGPSQRACFYNDATRGRSMYSSVSAALAVAHANDENVCDGTVWTGVARTETLAALDPKHNDVDGVSLAGELWYFFDADTFGANAILAGLAVGSYLVRLNSTMTQFVVSFVREIGTPVHVLLDVDAVLRTVTTLNAPHYATIRELVSRIAIFKSPVSRLAYAREFVDCAIELRARPLGVGAGGVVLRGQLNGSIAVAVKWLLPSDNDSGADVNQSTGRRLLEAESMLKIAPHRNVNRLYGLVLKPMALMIEFCDRGSLDQLLGIADGGGEVALVLTTSELWLLARYIARGLAHLHQARIVHRDLATRNILVSSPLVPKVCNFGMSRAFGLDETTGTTEELRGPVKWQAPEQLRGTRRTCSFKSDVFSFAVLLTEAVNNQLPWHDLSNLLAANEVVKGERTAINSRCAPALLKIIRQCWATDPDNRPTMFEVCAMLDKPMSIA
jgi:hypothetical protein